MRDKTGYSDLVIPWHAGQPRFRGMVEDVTNYLVQLREKLAHLPQDFDIDEAVGVQLDVVGEWVGRSRNILIPIPNIWFSFDDESRGWNRGVWKGPYDRSFGLTSLDDETYRRLLYAKIMINNWDGTTTQAKEIISFFFNRPLETTTGEVTSGQSVEDQTDLFDVFFGIPIAPDAPTTTQGYDASYLFMGIASSFPASSSRFFVDDRGDMSVTYAISQKIPPGLTLALFSEDYLPLNPGGVTTYYRVVSVDNTPMFGFGVQNEFVGGFGIGSWGVEPMKAIDAALITPDLGGDSGSGGGGGGGGGGTTGGGGSTAVPGQLDFSNPDLTALIPGVS
jgi:hypothetical protein